jgi:hypothetical protein
MLRAVGPIGQSGPEPLAGLDDCAAESGRQPLVSEQVPGSADAAEAAAHDGKINMMPVLKTIGGAGVKPSVIFLFDLCQNAVLSTIFD